MATGTAAEMLRLVGDNPERIHSEAAFAKLCGACPVPASSGKTIRHRLNRYVVREISDTSAPRQPWPMRPQSALHRYRSINALAENVIGLFKTEVIHRRGPWRSLKAVEYTTLEWVDWFNTRRLLEPIGTTPPTEADANH